MPAADVEAAARAEAVPGLIAKYRHEIPDGAIEAVAGKLGSHLTGHHLTDAQRARGRAEAGANGRRQAIEVYSDLLAEMRTWRGQGMTLAAIAERLNEQGDRTRTGARWSKVQVKRLLDRAKAAGQ